MCLESPVLATLTLWIQFSYRHLSTLSVTHFHKRGECIPFISALSDTAAFREGGKKIICGERLNGRLQNLDFLSVV